MSRSKRPKRNCNDIFEVEELEDGTSQAIFLPSNDSGTSDNESESELEFLVDSAGQIPKQSYSQILNEYDNNQSKLEPNHVYEWVIGEKRHEAPCNKLLLSDPSKKKLQELNGLDITLNELQTFLGIVITSIVNGRKSERDYWKTNKLLRCEPIASAMSRNDFLKIKRNIKLNKPEDANNQDKVWRVRNVLEIFRKNIAQPKRNCNDILEVEELEDGTSQAIFLPSNDSGTSDSESESELDFLVDSAEQIPKQSYSQILNEYDDNQSKLEPNHVYEWVIGEKRHEAPCNKLLLSDPSKKKLQELNGLDITLNELQTFLGIVITSIVNGRKSERDYWKTNKLLRCEPIASAMSRNDFLKIKHSESESELDFLVDSAEQIPKQSYSQILNEYDNNQSKLEPNHVYEWVIGEKRYEAPCNKLLLSEASKKNYKNCQLNGLDITLNELQTFLGIVITSIVNGRKSERDYWKTNKLLRCEPIASAMSRNDFLKIKRNIKLNKPEDANNQDKVWRVRNVLEIFRKNIAHRYSKENNNKNNIPFPMAFSLYNRNMGGVDLHDAHCSNLLPIIRAKKWTWAVLCRFIQSSITNATVFKKGTKEISLELAENYLSKTKIHKSVVADSKRNCENIKNCGSRTQKMCVTCNVYSCSNCFPIFHN
ncbi:hypothetical protein TSAR_003955 [Trichomalopsis sarcophagae]|uniref:PiggyBac transposable element-derived protein domain-containing protein n=1 Tax=Trichomalopsis sarcophagae TaxID=543379 RepID=A0A232EGU5_9HYME|nr:hypothetical protein TSAR_003955 [Trichomalopsis sarcophagae]